MDKEVLNIFSFEKSRDSSTYVERLGEPKELDAVIGLISLKFQMLEDNITGKIIEVSGLSQDLGLIFTAELSFKNKVQLFSSLCEHLKSTYEFNYIPGFEKYQISTMVKAFHRCEELRNQILHSTIIMDYKSNKIRRKKITAKSRQGLKVNDEVITIPFLMDVADFCGQMDYALDEFFILAE